MWSTYSFKQTVTHIKTNKAKRILYKTGTVLIPIIWTFRKLKENLKFEGSLSDILEP